MKTSIKVFHWLPRVICIIAILFISMFALDAFEPGLTLWQQLEHFIMHLIPSFVMLAFLLVAWKWEKIGGIIFLVVGLTFTPYIFKHNYNMNHSVWLSLSVILMITMPFVAVGILFVVSDSLKKNGLTKI